MIMKDSVTILPYAPTFVLLGVFVYKELVFAKMDLVEKIAANLVRQ